MRKKYILWDLDGTIVNSEDEVLKSAIFSYACEETGLAFNLIAEDFIGHTGHDVFNKVLRKNKLNEESSNISFSTWENLAVQYLKRNIDKVTVHDNVVEIWMSMYERGFGHAVVTSSYKDIAMTYLENAGLLNICEYITSLESINFPKPNPEPYLFTMEKLQITNRDCIAVEDSPSGIRSARSAGLFTVAWVKDVNDTKYEDANIILSKLSSPQISSFFL